MFCFVCVNVFVCLVDKVLMKLFLVVLMFINSGCLCVFLNVFD